MWRHYITGIVWLAGFWLSIWWPTRVADLDKRGTEIAQVLSILLMTAVLVLI